MSALLRALNAPRRREILRLVWNGERSAGEIHRSFAGDVTFGAVSQHLRVLSEAGLVASRWEGNYRYYLACKDELGPLREWLESMWDSALDRLTREAELEAARRGPRQGKRRGVKRPRKTASTTRRAGRAGREPKPTKRGKGKQR
jgi:DNA-binding transcriptional ArsR family regulator